MKRLVCDIVVDSSVAVKQESVLRSSQVYQPLGNYFPGHALQFVVTSCEDSPSLAASVVRVDDVGYGRPTERLEMELKWSWVPTGQGLCIKTLE